MSVDNHDKQGKSENNSFWELGNYKQITQRIEDSYKYVQVNQTSRIKFEEIAICCQFLQQSLLKPTIDNQ